MIKTVCTYIYLSTFAFWKKFNLSCMQPTTALTLQCPCLSACRTHAITPSIGRASAIELLQALEVHIQGNVD